jgi:hypothetical protein
MSQTKTEIQPSKDFEAALARSEPEDFDGHTEFHRLTAEQRLEWLCEAATFVYEFKGKAHSSIPLPSDLALSSTTPTAARNSRIMK